MRRLICILMALLLPLCAFALELDGEASISCVWPEDTGNDPVLLYHAAYPHAAGEDPVSLSINETYAYLLEDAASFTVPILGEMLQGQGSSCRIDVSSQVMLLNEDYLSVRILTVNESPDERKSVLAGHTFALQGAEAGSVLTLARLLGVYANTGNDTWLEERQTARLNTIVWQLVREEIENEGADDRLDEETLQAVFYPEEDFYLNEQGDIVFFLQPGVASDEAALFVFSPETLLDEW